MVNFYLDVLQAGVSCLLLISVGFILSKFQVFSGTEFKVFNHVNSDIALPFLLFRSMASRKIREISFLPLINALLMSASTQLCTAFVCFIFPFKDKLATYLSTVISSVYINYLVIGLPIFNSIWGTNYNHIPSICTFTHYILLVPSYLVLSQLWHIKKDKEKQLQVKNVNENKMNDDSQKDMENENKDVNEEKTSAVKADRITIKDVGMAFYITFKSPIVIGNVIGLVWSAIGIEYYPFFERLGKYLGDIVLVFALVSIGRFLQVNSLLSCHWFHLISCLFIRCFVCPGFSALFAWAMKLDGRLARQCIVLSALPAANAGFVMATKMGIGAGVASAMVFWSLIIIVPVLIFWFFIFNHFGLFPDPESS